MERLSFMSFNSSNWKIKASPTYNIKPKPLPISNLMRSRELVIICESNSHKNPPIQVLKKMLGAKSLN